MLGDSNNPKPEGLGFGKSQDFGLNLTAMGPYGEHTSFDMHQPSLIS